MMKHHLHTMGIVTWRLRQPISAVHSIFDYYQLVSQDAGPIAQCVVERGAHQQDESDLLSAIFQALSVTAILIEKPNPMTAPHWIVFGAEPPDITLGSQKIEKIITYSLAQMLEKPILKREVWGAISARHCERSEAMTSPTQRAKIRS